MGSIYKRGNIYWIKYYFYGTPYRESSRSRDRFYAERLLKKREEDISGLCLCRKCKNKLCKKTFGYSFRDFNFKEVQSKIKKLRKSTKENAISY